MRIKPLFKMKSLLMCSLFILTSCFLLSCQENRVETPTSTTISEKPERTDITADLGEIDNLSKRFFPETRVNRLYVRLISVPLSEIVSSIQYDNHMVRLTLLPVKTHMGKVISGADILQNIILAYQEDIGHFSANIIESSSELLDVTIVFDREIDFEEEFYSLPIYPTTYLNGEDFDSLGEYRVTGLDLSAQKISLSSEHSESIVIMHGDFEISKAAFESGDLDVLYLPHSHSAKLWADTVRGEQVKIPSRQVYMLGFGPNVPYEQRVMLYLNLANAEFINNEMGGFGEMTNYPAQSRMKYDLQWDAMEPVEIPYICFADSEWSYQFYRHLEHVLSTKNVYLKTVFTDFMTMMHMAHAEDSSYVYAFAWDISAKTPLSELLGESIEGYEPQPTKAEPALLSAEAEERYFNRLPVIPIAAPYDYYLIRSSRFKKIIEPRNGD